MPSTVGKPMMWVDIEFALIWIFYIAAERIDDIQKRIHLSVLHTLQTLFNETHASLANFHELPYFLFLILFLAKTIFWPQIMQFEWTCAVRELNCNSHFALCIHVISYFQNWWFARTYWHSLQNKFNILLRKNLFSSTEKWKFCSLFGVWLAGIWRPRGTWWHTMTMASISLPTIMITKLFTCLCSMFDHFWPSGIAEMHQIVSIVEQKLSINIP